MIRRSRSAIAALFAAFFGLIGFAPAQAASVPAGSVLMLEQASKPIAEQARYHGRRVYRPARAYRPAYAYRRPVAVRRHVYRPRPVYRPYVGMYRPCVIQRRWVWTPYGYAWRRVRVCR